MAGSDRGAIEARGARAHSALGWLMQPLIAYVTDTGHDARPILQLPGLRGRNLDDPDGRIPDETARDAWRLAATITADAALGLHLAQSLPRGSLDLVEYAFRSSPTLGAGLLRLARYGRLLNDRLAGELFRTPQEVRLLLGDGSGPPAYPQRAEFSMAIVLRLAREATRSELAPTEVCFAHVAPPDTLEHRQFFRGPVRFNAGGDAIAFALSDVNRPLLTADDALAAIIRRRLDKALAAQDRAGEPSTTARVRRKLLDSFGQGGATSSRIASELGLSGRSLSRRLRAEGTSFRAVAEQARGEIAATLLRDPGVSVAEVAFFLGYSEPAAFHRAFKRWTSRTPAEYRRHAPRV
jgi:AraC-like DNA-binding protein